MPSNWIFISESKEKLFKSDSVVRKLQNKIKPFMMQVPAIYSEFADFLAQMGVEEAFTFDQLKSKMLGIKNKFGEDQLDNDHFKAAVKIANEMISVLVMLNDIKVHIDYRTGFKINIDYRVPDISICIG